MKRFWLLLILVLAFGLAFLFQPSRVMLATPYDRTVRLVDHLGNVLGGTASAVTGNYDLTARVVNSSGQVLDTVGTATPIRIAVNANCNGVFLYDGVISSSVNPTFLSSASATWTTADVGKAIEVDGAGAAGAPLITTIASVTNSHNVVLAAGASTTVASGGYIVYGTDVTAAFVTAMNATATTGGRVLAPLGVCILDGSFTNPSTENALIPIPVITQVSSGGTEQNSFITVELDGQQSPGTAYPEASPLIKPPATGTILYAMTPVSGTWPSVIGGPITGQAYTGVTTIIRDLTVRTRAVDGYRAIQLFFSANAVVEDVTVDVNQSNLANQSTIPQPTNNNDIAILLPGLNNYGLVSVNRVYVVDHKFGIDSFEHARISNAFLEDDWVGMLVDNSIHTQNYDHITFQRTPTLFKSNNTADIEVSDVDIEFSNSGWQIYTNGYFVDDASNVLSGSISAFATSNPSFVRYNGGNYLSYDVRCCSGVSIPAQALTFGGGMSISSHGVVAPTLTACGTSPSVVSGTNFSGSFTTGSGGTVTACTLNFSADSTFRNAPNCSFYDASGSVTPVAFALGTTTTAAATFDGTAASLTSKKIGYICIGT